MDLQTKIRTSSYLHEITDEKEIQGILSIFSDENILSVISKTETLRRIKIATYVIVTISVVGFIIWYAAGGGFSISVTNNATKTLRPSTLYDGILLAFFPFIICSLLLRFSLNGKTEKQLKDLVIGRLLAVLQPNIEYAPDGTYACSIE